MEDLGDLLVSAIGPNTGRLLDGCQQIALRHRQTERLIKQATNELRLADPLVPGAVSQQILLLVGQVDVRSLHTPAIYTTLIDEARDVRVEPAPLGYPGVMTKRLIDIDDDKLEAVKVVLGTGTVDATVNDALVEVIALDERRRALLAERSVDPGDLAEPEERRSVW